MQDFEIAGSSAADKFTTVQVFTTSCFALTLDYVFDSQGTVAHSRFTVDTMQTVRVTTASTSTYAPRFPTHPRPLCRIKERT